MIKFENESKIKLKEAVCNCCGKKMTVRDGILKEGNFHGDVSWGYFSKQDGTTCHFDLCEECFDRICATFLIPIETEDTKELL